ARHARAGADAGAVGRQHDDVPRARPTPGRREDDRDDLVPGVRGKGPLDRVAGRVEPEREHLPGAREGTVDRRLRRPEALRRPGNGIADGVAAAGGDEGQEEASATDADGCWTPRPRHPGPWQLSFGSRHVSPFRVDSPRADATGDRQLPSMGNSSLGNCDADRPQTTGFRVHTGELNGGTATSELPSCTA